LNRIGDVVEINQRVKVHACSLEQEYSPKRGEGHPCFYLHSKDHAHGEGQDHQSRDGSFLQVVWFLPDQARETIKVRGFISERYKITPSPCWCEIQEIWYKKGELGKYADRNTVKSAMKDE
jgi:hypothetical protein